MEATQRKSKRNLHSDPLGSLAEGNLATHRDKPNNSQSSHRAGNCEFPATSQSGEASVNRDHTLEVLLS